MKNYIEKRDVLCNLAELYLNTRSNNHISFNDSIMNSNDFDSISFLMLLALTYEKEEMLSIYSIDIDVSEDTRIYFINSEYKKIMKLKKDKLVLGKIILQDAKNIYEFQYGESNCEELDEICKKIFL